MAQENLQQKYILEETLEPNVEQRKAAQPDSSIWVSASAGTGKTKVLTDRVLRLLLPRSDGRPGTPPHRILCLTFTKAAAAEMALRIQSVLSRWTVMDDGDEQSKDTLRYELNDLLGRPASQKELQAARALFAQVLETPGGLKIMTIHSFCQSVLSRFPLEAGISPHCEVLDEAQALDLMSQAKRSVFARLKVSENSQDIEAFNRLLGLLSEDRFDQVLQDCIGEARQFTDLKAKYFGLDGLYTALCQTLEIMPGQNVQTVLEEAFQDKNFEVEKLRSICDPMVNSKKPTDRTSAAALEALLHHENPKDRAAAYNQYKTAFFTTKDEPKAKLCTEALAKDYPDIPDILTTEMERLQKLDDEIRSIECAENTIALLRVCDQILEKYSALKHQQSVLDYDDLILKTLDLFTKNNRAGWVLFKMDEGLDHILVDEAQDTNPEQWKILEALSEEFYSGYASRDDVVRTSFVVGDEKQSIYSFQRASPEAFGQMQNYFRTRASEAQQKWDRVDMQISFRSAKSILQSVDAVFNHPSANCLSDQEIKNIRHHSYRIGQAGLVELWPVFKTEEDKRLKEETNLWTNPFQITENRSPDTDMAQMIARKIKGWMDRGDILESHGRPIEAGDIMVLVRTRGALVDNLTRALKAQNIPVGGSDRMILTEQIVVKDILALMSFCLNPMDDLSLACVLKSPFIRLDEDALFELAYDRKDDSLWTALWENKKYAEISSYLSTFLKQSSLQKPYEFLTSLLHGSCPGDPAGGMKAIQKYLGEEAMDPVNELLHMALQFENYQTPSLQNFLQFAQHNDAKIKRDQNHQKGQVRIMTVHASKGLQAPIVILPDTFRTTKAPVSQADRRLLWPDKTGLDVPLWCPYKESETAIYQNSMQHIEGRDDAEYKRLLYVAMTRAEDRLYITGYQSKKKPLADSWYNYIQNAIVTMADIERINDPVIDTYFDEPQVILRLYNPQTRDPDRAKEKAKTPVVRTDEYSIPAWLLEKAPVQSSRAIPKNPSRIITRADDIAMSPAHPGSDNPERFLRGNVIHKLLEFLPDIPEQNRETIASRYLEKFSDRLPEDKRKTALKSVLDILKADAFKRFFNSDAQTHAELPVTGKDKDGMPVNGVIDRLVIANNDILILDYKTGLRIPENQTQVPVSHKEQLEFYKMIIHDIYPGYDIQTALLYTDGPKLILLD